MSHERGRVVVGFLKREGKKVGVGLVVIGLIVGYWMVEGRHWEGTDNAYVKGELTALAMKIGGYIEEVKVNDGQEVKAGEVLMRIGGGEYEASLRIAESGLREAEGVLRAKEARVRLAEAEVWKAEADVEGAKAVYERGERRYKRYGELVNGKAVSIEDYEGVGAEYEVARSGLRGAEARLRVAQAAHEEAILDLESMKDTVERKRAEVDLARINYESTILRAPVGGVIGTRSGWVGQYVRPGTIVMYIVALERCWVMANYKETQLRRIRVGQRVEVKVDTYGEVLEGEVEAIEPSSGAEVALLPPDNSTGNFTKIVQRVPVKVKLKGQKGLRIVPGMSVRTEVRTKG